VCCEFPRTRRAGEILLKPNQNHLMHKFLPLQTNDYQAKANPVRIFARSRNCQAI
jgi:hypothetical protein